MMEPLVGKKNPRNQKPNSLFSRALPWCSICSLEFGKKIKQGGLRGGGSPPFTPKRKKSISKNINKFICTQVDLQFIQGSPHSGS